jgi:galactokinase/mevalonate kinase-like predicted kinase
VHYELTIPARINILGNPTDANEGDYATLSAAVDVFAGATVEPAEGVDLQMLPCRPGGSASLESSAFQAFNLGQHPLPYNGWLDLLKGAFNRLYHYSSEFRERYRQHGVRLNVWSEVPRQSGLGGSSLLPLLALAGLRLFYRLDPLRHNDYVLAELAQRVEANELNITCGYADRYVPLFGGLAYLDYRGKLEQKALKEEPYATYERLDGRAPDLSLVAVSTGVQHHSGDVHGQIRPRYLEAHRRWQTEGGPAPEIVQLMQAAWECAWRGKIALLENDLAAFGEMMNHNHRLVDRMMALCGFSDGAGWANNLFIQAALENGALGAKLTGAGGGGSAFALVRPGDEPRLLQAWQHTAEKAGLRSARLYQPRIVTQGLQWRRR